MLLVFFKMSRCGIAFKQAARDITQLIVFRISGQEAWAKRREPPGGNEDSTTASKVCEFFERLQRHAFHSRQDHHTIAPWAELKHTLAFLNAADLAERVVIEKIQIESGFEDLRHYI